MPIKRVSESTLRLSDQEVLHIAELARLDVGPDELAVYAEELSRILELVEQMDAVDTGGVEPMAHPQELALRLRPDEVAENDQRESFQALAPEAEAGLYLVPKVIE